MTPYSLAYVPSPRTSPALVVVVVVVNKYVSLHVCPSILFLTALFTLIILPGSTSPGQHFIISYIGVTRNNSVEDQTDFLKQSDETIVHIPSGNRFNRSQMGSVNLFVFTLLYFSFPGRHSHHEGEAFTASTKIYNYTGLYLYLYLYFTFLKWTFPPGSWQLPHEIEVTRCQLVWVLVGPETRKLWDFRRKILTDGPTPPGFLSLLDSVFIFRFSDEHFNTSPFLSSFGSNFSSSSISYLCILRIFINFCGKWPHRV